MHLIGVFCIFWGKRQGYSAVFALFPKDELHYNSVMQKSTAERRLKMTVKQRVIASLLVEKAAENRELADKVGLVCRLKQIDAMRKISEMKGGEEE
ncbi:MAG TPA: hypothetical protein DCY17_00305 [Clostridiales bacterium]|nr:hypothetical protein [Clostridiales bacterium]